MRFKKKLIDWAYHKFWALPLPDIWKEALHDRYRRAAHGSPGAVNAQAESVYKAFRSSVRDKKSYTELHGAYQADPKDPKLLAYYLPQFHPTVENDEWWGKGVTEWNNVTRSLPQFDGHRQPRVPADLGYYDLRLDQVLHDQAALASSHGIAAFAVYFYWFGGQRKLLRYPLDRIAALKEFSTKFCLCWANESWTRRFDGVSSSILMEQDHSQETYLSFLTEALDYLRSPNHLVIDGKLPVVIYRPHLIPDPAQAIAKWRSDALAALDKELYVIAVRDFAKQSDWIACGFDAETSFQPSQVMKHQEPINKELRVLNPNFSGKVFSYREIVENKLYFRHGSKHYLHAVAAGWDNSPRRDNSGVIYNDDSPELYRQWLQDALTESRQMGSSIAFINAWNEWGEGAYLEPDSLYGAGKLLATKDAIIEARIANA